MYIYLFIYYGPPLSAVGGRGPTLGVEMLSGMLHALTGTAGSTHGTSMLHSTTRGVANAARLSLHAASTRSFVQPAQKQKRAFLCRPVPEPQFMLKQELKGSRTTASAATGRATYQGTTMTAIIDSARPLPGCGRPVVT